MTDDFGREALPAIRGALLVHAANLAQAARSDQRALL
jgi:hypothetical protein